MTDDEFKKKVIEKKWIPTIGYHWGAYDLVLEGGRGATQAEAEEAAARITDYKHLACRVVDLTAEVSRYSELVSNIEYELNVAQTQVEQLQKIVAEQDKKLGNEQIPYYNK